MLHFRNDAPRRNADTALALEMMMEQDMLYNEEPLLSDRMLQWIVAVMLMLQIAGVAMIIVAYLA